MTDQARRLVAALVALGAISAPIRAQTDGTCIPVAERAGRDFGCFITARESLGKLSADSLAAVYMEGVFQPGMQNVVHRHHGAEAWYTLEGAMCLETPEGKIQQTAGDTGVLVRAGLPMVLTGTVQDRVARSCSFSKTPQSLAPRRLWIGRP